MKITGTREAIKAARKHIDAPSGKPDTRHPYPCECGAYGIATFDDDADLVQCSACGAIRHAGGATLRVYRDHESDVADVWECECSEDVAEKIKAAKAKPKGKRDKDENELAAVDVDDKGKDK